MAQQHDLVMMGEKVIGYGDAGGPHDGVDEAVLAVRERAVIDPNVSGPEDGDPVAVGSGPVTEVGRAGSDVGVARLIAVVDVDVVDDDVGDVLERNATPARYVHVSPAPV